MKIDITPAQLKAIKSLANDADAMLGSSEFDYLWERYIKHIDSMLKRNNLPPRDYS